MGAEFLFMEDNARPHRSNIVDECLQSEDITRMDCPAYSLDLNPIDFHAEIVEVEIEVVSPSIVPSGNFAELNRTVTYMVLKANDRRTSSPMPR
ncbi:DDE_3 domain-containing protein [Trichonephila clavipes]|nr:DDE_3 domain-containing protein [Trichonephila clavipes]